MSTRRSYIVLDDALEAVLNPAEYRCIDLEGVLSQQSTYRMLCNAAGPPANCSPILCGKVPLHCSQCVVSSGLQRRGRNYRDAAWLYAPLLRRGFCLLGLLPLLGRGGGAGELALAEAGSPLLEPVSESSSSACSA